MTDKVKAIIAQQESDAQAMWQQRLREQNREAYQPCSDGKFYFKTERISGGFTDDGRWRLKQVVRYYSTNSEKARESAITASPQRCMYDGQDISHQRIGRSQIPADASIVDISNLNY